MLMVLSKGYNKYIPQSRTVFESNYTFNSTLVRDLDTVSSSVEYIVGKTSVPLQINGYRYDNTDIRSLNFINTITGHYKCNANDCKENNKNNCLKKFFRSSLTCQFGRSLKL